MIFNHFKTFESGTVADGAVYEDDWLADKDYVIKRIFIKRKDRAELTKSTFYFAIADRVYTREIVPCNIVGEDVLVSPVLEIPFSRAEKLNFTFKNLEGVTVEVFIVFETYLKE